MSIYDKKYQIFVSSTYTDLIKSREEVIKVILSLYQIPIGMEMFSADNEEQWSIIQATIDSSDYYLLIVGHKYGSLTKEDISYTEKEFDYAKSLGIPVISFIRTRDTPTTPNERDSDLSKIPLLELFLKKVMDNSMCDFWTTQGELGQKVAIAFTKLFFKNPRIGWVRADKSNSLETTEELAKLSQENRELREEIIKLKSNSLNEKPNIEVKLNNNNFDLKLVIPRFLDFIKILPSHISDNLKDSIDSEEIITYNNHIDTKKEDIELYKKDFIKYENVKNNNQEIVIEISNIGKGKANDIFIDIEFPREVILFEKNDLNKFKKPNNPLTIENPLNKAFNLRHKKTGLDYLDRNISFSESVIGGDYFSKISNINKNYFIDKEKNTLTIKLLKLTQTRTIIIKDNIMIAPLKKGLSEIKINIICDEFIENREYVINLNIL